MVCTVRDSIESVLVVIAVTVTPPNSYTVGARPISGICCASISLISIVSIHKLVRVLPKASRQVWSGHWSGLHRLSRRCSRLCSRLWSHHWSWRWCWSRSACDRRQRVIPSVTETEAPVAVPARVLPVRARVAVGFPHRVTSVCAYRLDASARRWRRGGRTDTAHAGPLAAVAGRSVVQGVHHAALPHRARPPKHGRASVTVCRDIAIDFAVVVRVQAAEVSGGDPA